MLRIRKDDIVKVIAGKDRGKTGKVLSVSPKINKALVEGINFFKKHTRKTQKDQKGGIVEKEMPIAISNLMLICKSCNKAVRIGVATLKDGSRTRVCKICKETI